MFSQTWRRPTECQDPEIWKKFEKNTKEEKVLKFWIQTITEEYFDDVFDMMYKYFVKEETLHASARISESNEYKKLLYKMLKTLLLPHKMSLMCLLDENSDEKIHTNSNSHKAKLVGFNLCGICDADADIDLSQIKEIEAGTNLLRLWNAIKSSIPNAFEKYGVKEYLGSLGLSVHPDYRGMNIGFDLLQCRIEMCKAVGIKLTSALFTADTSQHIARKAGFVEDGSILYSEIEEEVGIKIITTSRSCKQFSYVIE